MKITIESLFSTVTDLTGDGLCLCEIITGDSGEPVDYRFIEVNDRFEEYTGLVNATGRRARELVPELEQHWIDTYARVGLGRESIRFESGSEAMGRWFEVFASPAPDAGQLYILFRDVSQRKQAELERERAVEAGERLLDELSHRVKNSLGVVSGILSLEARAGAPELRGPLSRISSRVAAVSKLYDAINGSGNIDEVAADPYLTSVVDGVRLSLLDSDAVSMTVDIEDCVMPGKQAISLGLIVNELVTNSAKHAFPDGRTGNITVRLEHFETECRLTVSDDGVGSASSAGRTPGLGSKLVRAFSTDLDGRIEARRPETGTETVIVFPRPGAGKPGGQ